MTFLKPSYPLDVANTIAEVLNGGFEQLWENSADEAPVMMKRTARYLRAAGWLELAEICEEVSGHAPSPNWGEESDADLEAMSDHFYDHVNSRSDWDAFKEAITAAADAAEGAG